LGSIYLNFDLDARRVATPQAHFVAPQVKLLEQHGCGFGWWVGGVRLDRAHEFFMRTLD
jgi:hypothetical protein